jgi:hypothetical protein
MTRLILNRPHTHAGRLYAPGDRLDVAADTADWLIVQGVAVPEPATDLADEADHAIEPPPVDPSDEEPHP